jgi:NAD(P)-dependent dehydrogenase (short-subunit alcohol dehydrogenase family)
MRPTSTRLAVVTGAASEGIGTAITRRLVADGHDVVGTYEPEDAANAEALRSELATVTLVETDHADREQLDRFVRGLASRGRVQVLVNAQFHFAMENPDAFDFAIWDRSLAVNLTAPLFLFHRISPYLAADAAIVTVTSTEGFVGSYGAAAYAATKAAAHNLTMTLANIAGERGATRVNAVAAGWIGGVMDTDEVFEMSRSITPLRRLGSPEEIAAVVAFLASSASSFVNGTVITADGGYRGVDTIAKHEYETSRAETASSV